MTEPRTLPGLGLTGYWPAHSDSWKPGMDANLRTLSALLGLAVESRTSALPGSPTNGMIYLVKSDDPTNPNKIALRDDGAWVYLTPMVGLEAWVKDTSQKVRYTGSGWTVIGGSSVSVAIESEGVEIDAGATRINFSGDAVAVSSDGSGNVDVTFDGGGGGSLETAFTPPPAAATWIQQNFDATKTHIADFASPVDGVRIYEDIFNYGNTNALRAALKAIPGTHWQVTARMRRHTRMPQFGAWGLVVRDATGGRSCVMGFNSEAGGLGMLKLASDTSYTGFQGFGGNQMPWRSDIWFRAKYDGTDCSLWHSFDGVYWTRTALVASGTALWNHLANAASHVGFGYNINNNGAGDIGNEVDLLSWEAVSLP